MREYEQLRQTWDGRDTSEPIGDFIDVGDRVAMRFIWRGAGQGPEAELELTSSGPAQRQHRRRGLLPGPRGGARNLGAAGVGDVAGERGDRAVDLRGLGAWRLQLGRVGASRDRVRVRRRAAPGGRRGWPGWRRASWLAERLGGWRVEAEEYRELDGERVLVLFHFSGRGKTSGLEVGQIWTKGASLFHLRGGKVTKLVQYFDRAEPSKPWGCGSRRCRRRMSNSIGAP